MNDRFSTVATAAAFVCVSFTGSVVFAQSNTNDSNLAQNSPNPIVSDAPDDEIIVTVTRQPTALKDVLATAEVITRADIDRLQPRDLPSLLGRLGGVDFRDSGGRGSASGVFIRGAAPAQTLILIDGVRAASATLGTTALEGIPIEAIERIELV